MISAVLRYVHEERRLKFATGTLDEALGWIEYCNSTKNTYYANLRRKNGREEPYNVSFSFNPVSPRSDILNRSNTGL